MTPLSLLLLLVLRTARVEIERWAASCTLSLDPEMGPLHNRAGDNWRPLLSIADSFGRGEEARAAASELSANLPDEDLAVLLLSDIRTIFLGQGVDRVSSASLIEALLALDDGMWAEWRGPNDDRPPRKLTQAELAMLLRPFGIKPRTVWPIARKPGDSSSRGYYYSQFERAWAAYCAGGDTPTHPQEIKRLRQS